MINNPFDITKAVDYTDQELYDYWVDLNQKKGFNHVMKPTTLMPMIIIGSKGSGKTHIMKYYSYELQKITDKLEDTKLAHRIIQKATKLPTSHVNLSAFIMKCVEYSSDKIGYNMVAGSAGSIDHLIPHVKNGKDSLDNYGISSAYYNSERAERSITQQLRKYPKTYENCQKQVDRLIELCNNGTFKKVGLSKQYIINFAKRMYNLSPQDKRLELNLDKLK